MDPNHEKHNEEQTVEVDPNSSHPPGGVPIVLVEATEDARHINLGWRSWTVIFVTCIAIGGQVFVVTAAGGVIAFIQRDLGKSESAGWIIQGPLLIQSILSPSYGRLSDVLDRRYMVAIPPLFALVGAIVSARATTMETLVGAGFLIGVTLPSASIVHAIQAEVLPNKYRAIANSFSFLGAAAGVLISSLGAGYLTNQDPKGWRSIFYVQAAFHALTSLGFLLFYWPKRTEEQKRISFKQLLWDCDPYGSFLYITAVTLILLSLDWAGGTYEWSDPHIIGALVVGLVVFMVFCLYEWKGRNDGLVSHSYFQYGPNFPISVFAFTVEGWVFYSAVNSFVPKEVLEIGFEDNAWSIAVRQLTYTITAPTGSILVTWWATRFKDLKRPLIASFILFLITCICYANLTPDMNKAQIVYNIICGFGQAGPLTLIVPLVQFSAPHAFMSTASGLAYSGRAIGGAFGSAVLNAIFHGYMNSHHTQDVSSTAVNAGLNSSSVSALVKALDAGKKITKDVVPGITPSILDAATRESRLVHANAYKLAWWSIVPFVTITIVSLFFIRDVKQLMTEKVIATVEKVEDEHTKMNMEEGRQV